MRGKILKASRTDKLFAVGIVAILIAVTLVYDATDGKAIRDAETSKDVNYPTAITITAPHIDCTPIVKFLEARRDALYWQDVPLDHGCQTALIECCEDNGVPICLALGLIEAESGFDPNAVSGKGCVGLMQLNDLYFPSELHPEDNIRAGVEFLGELLEKYDGDTQAALTAYNAGHDTGDRTYARAVLDASEKWGDG